MPAIRISDFLKNKIEEEIQRNGHTSADSVVRSWYLKSRQSLVTHLWTEEDIAGHFKWLKENPRKNKS